MADLDRRTELRREEDRVLAYRVEVVEDQIKVFAPVATTVAVHEHQLDEGAERMKSLESGLKEVRTATDDLLTCIHSVKVEMTGMKVRLALIMSVGGLIAGTVASVVVALVT